MHYRPLGRTGWNVSTVSFGAWAIGSTWGDVKDEESLAALERAVDLGVNFFDTADVYGDGRSERLCAELRRRRRGETLIIATKAGRRLNPHVAAGYRDLTEFVERSAKNLQTDAIDLVQLHCPPTDVYYMPEVFDHLDGLVKAGKIKFYGVSVERVEEALKAIEYPGVQSVQIIFNVMRQRPHDLFLARAKHGQVGVLARLPLSSGMLTGKFTKDSQFAGDDHRRFNRRGQAFDKGETFSGVDYDLGLEFVERLRPLVPEGMTLTELALAWILMNDAVSCAIPGAKRPDQVEQNVRAADLPPLPLPTLAGIASLYEEMLRPAVHHLW